MTQRSADFHDGGVGPLLAAALDAGYTHIDTAEGYRNEREIGEVIAEYDRDELFFTSKILAKNLNYESVISTST